MSFIPVHILIYVFGKMRNDTTEKAWRFVPATARGRDMNDDDLSMEKLDLLIRQENNKQLT